MEFCKKNPRKNKKAGDLYNFFTDVDDFPAKSGQTDRESERRKAAGLRKSGGLRAKLYKCDAGMTGRKIVAKETQEGCLSL
ncbi:hypothetical protein [Dysosmobacter sp.]|uniref:hypothetical protein n=1 Tax=Dysosmobacter sp. TaxID=2591382 RepID=UPI0028528F83|nr:hypothetical protein [Dysosmobacter sp.]